MRNTLFIVLISAIQVFATESYAQTKKISLDIKDATIKEVLHEIEKQSEFYFLFNSELIDVSRKVDLTVKEQKVSDILTNLFSGNNVNFIIKDRYIVLTPSESSGLADIEELLQQQRTVSGSVTDNQNQPLPGVTIVVKGTTLGTITSADGNYTLSNIPPDATLVFSFVGMRTREVIVGNQTTINVTMEEETIGIEEVIAVGYGTQKKVNLTGAVDVITNEKMANRQAPTVSQILQGQAPGLNFSVGTHGFEPGASMNIDIRGMGSINGGSPYILIDGIPGEMDRLNPNDIESISVLKDAAASAIYGARAPYGVILITTKSGKKNEELSISYAGNMSVHTPSRLPQQLDSYTFARVINEMGDNGGGRSYSEAAIDRIIAYQNKDWNYLKQFYPEDATYYEAMPLSNGRWGNNQDSHANYDWYDEWYGYSLNQQHNLSVRGGEQKTSYFLSAGFVDENGVLNYGTDYYKRYNLVGKINTALADWWDVRYQARFVKDIREYPSQTRAWDYDMIFRQIPRTVPTQAKYTGYGTYNIQSKIPFVEDSGTKKYETRENWHTLGTEIRPVKGWKINGEFAYRSTDYLRTNLYLTFYEHYINKEYVANAQSVPNSLERIHQISTYWTTNIYSSYDFSLKNHNFHIMAGTQYELNQSNYLNGSKTNLIVPDVPSLETATGDPIISENLTHWATQGYFGRFAYNFNEKYLFEANTRYDGTSRFLENSRWGFFPSFSVGWNVNRENFWESIEPYINTFKVRASWGQLGNQQVSPYQDIALIPLQSGRLNWLFGYGSNRPLGYTSTPGLVSPNLTWETATTSNIGFNLAFLENRLQFDLDIFERNTDNMIGPSEPVPGVLGSSVPKSNNASLRTRGWESSIKWNHNIRHSDFSYFVTFNLYDAKTVVTEYLNPTGLITDWYSGKEIGEIWGYTANELFKSQEEVNAYLEKVDLSYIFSTWNPGDLKYEDTNGDDKVDVGARSLDDHGDLSVIGNSTPRYQWGISAGLNYKNFDFSFLIKGTAKRDYFPEGATSENYVFWGIRNWLFTALQSEHLDYFRDQPGDKYTGLHEGDANINLDAFWPRPYLATNQNAKNRQNSTRYLVDASYIRLQNVQLGYNLPANILGKIGLKQVRVFVSGENLFTMTDFLKGIDPIAISGGGNRVGMTYGADNIYSFGINATF